MLGTMLGRGWQIIDRPDDADAVVVNTCGFIDAAKEESVDTILRVAALKGQNPNLKVVVAGCLTQRYKSQLSRGLPEVDLFIGTDEFPRLGDLLTSAAPGTVHARRTNYLYTDDMPRVNTLAKHAAYVKVAEGCQHNCAFCIIPAIRGRLRSRSVESVVREAQRLAAAGVLEINLIAQDLAAYGRDRDDGANLLGLLQALVMVEGLRWIRCLYVYPEHISDEFLAFFAREPKIVKYLDIPVQHASDRILKSMRRQVTRDELAATIAKVRTAVPDVAIRTSVMVGFPGETADDFAELKAFVQTVAFDHLGCFTYSKEEGTVAARLPQQIDEETKVARQAEIMAVQREVSKARLGRYVGRTLQVLVEGVSEESEHLWQGRLATQAPEVDGVVYLADGPVQAGTIQNVAIVESHDYDLVGHVLAD